MTDHARELAVRLGVRGPTRADIPFMIDAAAKTAWATDQGMTIAIGVVTALREARILLPSISTIERASSAGRARARKQAAYALITDLRTEQVNALDQLFDDAGGMSQLASLKTIPVAAKPDHIRQILDRLRQVRKIGISPDVAGRIHADRFRQYVREGRASPAYMIERYILSRRRATLVAFLLDLEERLTDSALEMADKLIGSIFSRARNAQARNYAATSKNVARLMLIFRRTIDALTDGIDTGEDPIEALDASVGWTTLLKARPEVATIAETASLDPLTVAADRYVTLRKFAPDLIEALQFRAGKGSAKTIAAIEMLRDHNRSGKRDLPADAPMPFRKEWRKIVVGDDGKINRRLWEIATIAHLRNKLRSGDVWVERSAGYRRFDNYLLSEPKAKPIVLALGLPPTAGEWLEQRGPELDWRLKKFAQRLKRDALEGVRYRDDRLQISPVRTIATADAEALANRLDAMMPRIRITELLHEVAQETGFLAAFTNLRTGEPCPNENALLATILADATNLGLSRMAAASQGVTRDQLLWTHDAYIRTGIIGEQWDDVLRLVGSIKAGHVAPSVMLRTLAAYERQNQLDIALQEIGKIERTLFMLDWLENPDLRRRCHAGLNNSEQRHALTQAIYTFRQGRIIDRSHEAQQYRASGLNLVIAAIVYWNTIYMDAAAQHLRSTLVSVPEDMLAHTSPVGWEHIAFSGDFLWDRAAASAGRKALNLPPDSRAA